VGGRPAAGGSAAAAWPPEQRLSRVQEAAAVLGISRTTVYALISAGALRALKIGRSVRVAATDIDAYVDALRADAG
jgi:excisionase family DNA binding protein